MHRGPTGSTRPLALLLATALAAACSRSIESVHVLEYAEIGLVGDAGGAVVIDAHQGGRAPSLGLAQLAWGRLVDVYDLHPGTGGTTLRYVDFPVGPELVSDGYDYELERAPVTARDVLTILHPYGSPGWTAALERAEGELVELEASEAGPTLPGERSVPRDAVLVARFDDLLDVATLDSLVLEVDGLPLGAPRLEADGNHGGWIEVDGQAQFFPTRVLVDLAVTALDAERSRRVVARSPAGLPAPAQRELRNVTLRSEGLANLAGRSLRGPVAAFAAASSDEPFGGLLPAVGEPRLLGDQAITLIRSSLKPNGEFLLAWKMGTPACLTRVAVGDLVTLPGAMLEVVAGPAPVYKPRRGIAGNVRARLVAGSAGSVVLGAALYTSPFTPGQNDPPECFVRFTPQPGSPPAAGVDPQSLLILRFSEPMDVSTFEGLDTFTVRSTAPGGALEEHVIGTVAQSSSGMEMIFVPSLPLTHVAGQAESYLVTLSDTVRSLAGVSLLDGLPPTAFTLDPAAAPQSTGGLSLRFGSVDEDGDGKPEVRGQFLYDLLDRRLLPRPVSRFLAEASTVQPVVGAMVPNPLAPVFNPLTSHGSIVQTVWRYHDLGLGVVDDATLNIDVEGLSWSPVLAGLQIDNFPAFRLGLTHGRFLPDEAVDAMTGALAYPFSGLTGTFVDNLLTPLTVVHPKPLGYTVISGDFFQAPSGLNLAPWPLNRNVPVENFTLWTWRDTSIQAVGGVNSGGADTDILLNIVGGTKYYQPGQVPTVGLPLLMEFRTYANTVTAGNNQMATASATGTGVPAFRAHSTGGVLGNGNAADVDPDQEITARGLITQANPIPLDDTFYLGGADFVVRVSRAHTRWLDTGTGSPTFGPALVEPLSATQPAGTEVVVQWRGATSINNPANAADANNIDPYGNRLATGAAFTATFLNGDPGWRNQLADVDGARYVQARVTFVSNPVTGATAELSALGVPFLR